MANVSSSNGLEKRPKLRFPGFDEPWTDVHLFDVVDLRRKRARSVKEVYVSTENLLQDFEGVTPYQSDDEVEGIAFNTGDTLLANIRPYLKKAWYAAFDGTCSADVLAFSPKRISPAFLYNIIARDCFIEYVMSGVKGSKMPRGDKTHILEYEFAIPEKDEQEKIATFIALADCKIAKQRKMIAALKKYKRGLHKLVFVTKRKPFWEKLSLHDIASFCGGGTPSKDVSSYWEGEIGWISSSDIQEEWIDNISVTRRITKAAIDNSATKLCPEGTIAIVSRVGVGKVAIMPESLCTSQDFINIISITGNKHYMAYQIAFRMKLEAMKTQGTSIKGVTADTIKAMVLDIPLLDEQKKIADILTAFDSYIKKAVCELDLFLAMKKALLQQLFI